MHATHHTYRGFRLRKRFVLLILVIVIAVTGIVIGLDVSRTYGSAQSGSADWSTVCHAAIARAGTGYTATDENGNEATVTYCGFTITDSADSEPAEAGDVFVDTVFLMTANQAASFDPNSTLVVANSTVGAYVGNATNCGNGNENATGCPEMADAGGDMSAGGYATGNLGNLPPIYQGHPQLIVLSTQIPEQDSGGQMLVILANDNSGAVLHQLNSDGRQHLPVMWATP